MMSYMMSCPEMYKYDWYIYIYFFFFKMFFFLAQICKKRFGGLSIEWRLQSPWESSSSAMVFVEPAARGRWDLAPSIVSCYEERALLEDTGNQGWILRVEFATGIS